MRSVGARARVTTPHTMPLASSPSVRRHASGRESSGTSGVGMMATPGTTPASTSGSERKTFGRTPTLHLGRLELISWLNRALNADYASVQECADGVAYCQLLDALHPGKVALHRLDFNARFLGDCERNVKTLRDAMRTLDLKVDVDFDALASGKFIENNNLLRWFHAYVITHGSSALDAYDAFAARVRAQKMKEKAAGMSRTPPKTEIKTSAARARDAPGSGGGGGTDGSGVGERGAALFTPSSSNAAHFSTPGLSGHLVPNDVAVVSEMERRTSGADAFAFSPATELPATPAAPRALTYDAEPSTPQAFGSASGENERTNERDAAPSAALATSASGRRPLDRWATKAREKLDARAPPPSSAPPTPELEHVYEEETTSTCFGCFVVSRKITRTA